MSASPLLPELRTTKRFGLIAAATAMSCVLTWRATDSRAAWGYVLSECTSIAVVIWAIVGLRSVRDRRAWAWVVGGVALWIVGDIIWDVFSHLNGEPPPVSIADVAYLLAYPAMAIGIVKLIRLRSPTRNVEGQIDGLALGVSALLAAWELLIVPASETGSSFFAQVVSAGYPVGDVVLLAALGWLAFTPGRTSRSLRLLLLFGAVVLATDVAFVVATNLEAAGALSFVNSLGPLNYLILAFALHHPSVDDATEPAHHAIVRTNPMRIVMLGSTLYVVPVLMFLRLHNEMTGLGDLIIGIGGTTCLATLVVARFVLVIRDRETMQEAAAFRASHDQLTGLANRQLLLEHIDLAAHRHARTASPYAVLWIDLDRFKSVNDAWGHAMGDKVLIAAGRSFQRSVRPNDIVARVGGDEFAVLCAELTDPSMAQVIAERIVANLSTDLPIEAKLVAASVGVALASLNDPEVSNAESLLRRADLAMYRAKGEGGDAWRVFDEELRQWSDEQRSVAVGAGAPVSL